MNIDSYDTVLNDISCIKNQLLSLNTSVNVIENAIKLILTSVDAKKDDYKNEQTSMKKFVDVLPDDRLLDEFEHTEGTYKDYSRMTHDMLSDDEIKSFEAGQKGEVYAPEPMCKCPKYSDEVEECQRKPKLSDSFQTQQADG